VTLSAELRGLSLSPSDANPRDDTNNPRGANPRDDTNTPGVPTPAAATAPAAPIGVLEVGAYDRPFE
jgi:hypothetical protein